MCTTLEQIFYEKLSEMPADVRRKPNERLRFFFIFQEIEIVSQSSKSAALKNIGDGNFSISVLSPSTPSEHISSPCKLIANISSKKVNFCPHLVPSPSPRLPNGTGSTLPRNRTLSTTNASAVNSPFSPSSNHHDQNSQSMSPRLLIGEQPTTNPEPIVRQNRSIELLFLMFS